MKKIVFHGVLKAFGKKPYKAQVNSWTEACEFLQANVRNYSGLRKKMINSIDGCYFIVDGNLVKHPSLLDKAVKEGSKIDVVPVVLQRDPVTIAVAVVVSVVTTAISFLIAKMMTPKDPKQVKTSSYIIGGKSNLAARNTPIAIGYGRLRVAPPIVASYTINRDLSSIVDSSNTKAANASVITPSST